MQRLRSVGLVVGCLLALGTLSLFSIRPAVAQPAPPPEATAAPDVGPRRVTPRAVAPDRSEATQAAREAARERARRRVQERAAEREARRAERAKAGPRPPRADVNRARRTPGGTPIGATLELSQKAARIQDLIRRIGEATGRTILVPDDVAGRISIVAQRALTHDEAWALLESALSILGHSLLPAPEGIWRIAKVADAVGEAPFVRANPASGESFVTTLIPLQVADIEDVLPVLEPLSGTRVTLVPYTETNSLIASGSEIAIARLATLARELDRIEEATLRTRVLRYRGVEDVEPILLNFLEAGERAVRALEVWADTRTNSFTLRGADAAVERAVGFLADIDRPVEHGGAIQILRVLNRDPAEVAEILQSLGGASNTGGATPASLAALGPLDGADFSIAVDAPTRSLIIRARPETYLEIRRVVERLDVAAELIAVDLSVSELRTTDPLALASGFQLPFSALSTESDALVGFVRNDDVLPQNGVEPTFFGQISRDTGVAFTTEQGGAAVSIPIFQEGTIAAIDFEATNEVLIQPSLVVTAGESHEIFAGENIPIPVNDTSGAADGNTVGGIDLTNLSVTTRFERQDIGTRLTVEASTGREGKIQLDIDLELSRLDLASAGLAGDPFQVGPSYVDQSIVVSARLDHGETAILAISRDSRDIVIESGVPFFRNLPFIGFLFRSRGSIPEEVRLIVAARARRVSNPVELVADTIRRRLVFERSAAQTANLPDVREAPFGVRVTTRRLEEDARAIAESLDFAGHATRVHRWSSDARDYWDVYVTGFASMVDAATLARSLGDEGWETDVVVFRRRS